MIRHLVLKIASLLITGHQYTAKAANIVKRKDGYLSLPEFSGMLIKLLLEGVCSRETTPYTEHETAN